MIALCCVNACAEFHTLLTYGVRVLHNGVFFLSQVVFAVVSFGSLVLTVNVVLLVRLRTVAGAPVAILLLCFVYYVSIRNGRVRLLSCRQLEKLKSLD